LIGVVTEAAANKKNSNSKQTTHSSSPFAIDQTQASSGTVGVRATSRHRSFAGLERCMSIRRRNKSEQQQQQQRLRASSCVVCRCRRHRRALLALL
jgi:hypothetical protein